MADRCWQDRSIALTGYLHGIVSRSPIATRPIAPGTPSGYWVWCMFVSFGEGEEKNERREFLMLREKCFSLARGAAKTHASQKDAGKQR
jgi:hypothetical protein